MKSATPGIFTAIVHMVSGLAILLVSSWFIAACAIAGVHFNYMLPAVVIRALALLRIGSGYAHMWLSHHHLLTKLKKLRLDVFSASTDTLSVSRESQVNALSYQTEQMASVWIAWVGQNAGVVLAILISLVVVPVLLPQLTLWWSIYLVAALVLYSILLLKGIRLANEIQTQRDITLAALQRHVESASIWHLFHRLHHPNIEQLQSMLFKQQKRLDNGLSALLLLSFASLIVIIWHISHQPFANHLMGNPLLMLLPMVLLSANDWLGRAITSQNALYDYLSAKAVLRDTNNGNAPLTRVDSKISQIELQQFCPQITATKPVDLSIQSPGIYLIKGSSGSGKSRLLMAISGLIGHTGTRTINGQDQSLGLLSDSFYSEQFPYCLSDTLANNLKVADSKASDTAILESLKQVGLDNLTFLDQWIGEHGRSLSGGEKKRMGVARAILSPCSFLLLDEPFEALDQANIDKVCAVLKSLAKQKVVVIASHISPAQLQPNFTLELDAVTSQAEANHLTKQTSVEQQHRTNTNNQELDR